MPDKILVTGGCGYIGSHTIIDLVDNEIEVISIDNNSKSRPDTMDRVEAITEKKIHNYPVDLCDLEKTRSVFQENKDIKGIIHFAAYKTVPESVAMPLKYYRNNIDSLLNLMQCAKEFRVPNFVFSSSCSVYGNTAELPVVESTPFQEAECPYARTKQMGEHILQDYASVNEHFSAILLRYFNPVGAHESGLNGEVPLEKPNNLVPVITQTAIGKISQMSVFGNDYDTRDGTCIRDYIHVMDIANAHTKAMQYLLKNNNQRNCEVFNLGTGNGVTVLEAIDSFEKVSGIKLKYTIADRRPGDVVSIYANNEKAKNSLGWEIKRNIDEMMASAWKWEQNWKEQELSL